MSCEVGAAGADLRFEQTLLALQVVAHAVLQGHAEGVVPAGQEGKAGRHEGKVNVLEVQRRQSLQVMCHGTGHISQLYKIRKIYCMKQIKKQ